MNFSIDKLLTSLPIMGKGMLGVFVVTFVIILAVILMNKLSAKK